MRNRISRLTLSLPKCSAFILGMVRHENFKVEYLAAATPSAAASRVGQYLQYPCKRTLDNQRCPLYHHGGAGRDSASTPPLEAGSRPLRKRDCRALEKFKAEMAAYQNTMKESKGNNDMDRPVLRRTIVSDFAPEALNACPSQLSPWHNHTCG